MKKNLLFVLVLMLNITTILKAQTPVFSAINPTSAAAGTTVIIAGSNFTGTTGVYFGGVAATSFTVISSSAITAIVGNGASGTVSVINGSGLGSISGFTFITSPPTITSFSPSSGPIGTIVTITGTNFSTTPSNNIVYFGAVKATVTVATTNTLTVTVPYGATYLPITVNTNSLIAQSSIPFTVTFAGGGNAFTSNTFSTKIDYSVNPSPGQTAVSDLDGDGKADIIVANGGTSNSLSIFRNISNKGSVSLANRVDVTTTGSPYGLNYADLDGDGKPEITFTNYSTGNFGVFRNTSNNGSISLATEIDFASGTNPASTAFGDFDGDGKLDVVVGNVGSSSISVYRNLSTIGNISFATKMDYSTGSSPFVAAVADIDGDGKPDIIVSVQGSPIVTIFRNTSTGVGNISFTNAGNFTAGSGPRYVSVADIDGDGKLDLIVGNSSVGTVSILLNTSITSNISFATKVDVNTGASTVPTQISVADFDGDGKPDFVVADESPTNIISVFRNISTVGNISFNTTVNYTTDVNPYGVSTGDIDGDGKPDIIVANGSSSAISIFRNQVGEPVISSFSPTSQSTGQSVIINGANFTGVTGVSFGGVPATSYTVVSSTAIIATVGTGASGSVTVSTSNGVGSLTGFTFTVPPPTISSFTPTSGAIGTSITISGTNFSSTPANNIVYFGAVKATVTAASTTSLTVTVPIGATYQPITVNTNNLIAASAKPFIVTFAGGGSSFTTNTLSAKVDYATNGTNNTPGIADLDGDGKPEMIIITEGSNTIAVFRNTSSVKNISFATRQDISTSAFPLGGTFTDLDGDGKPDLAFLNHSNNNIGIIRNTSTGLGNISFSSEIDYATGSNSYYIAVGDLDGDGKPDLAVCNASSNTVSVYLNKSTVGNIVFAAQTTFTVGNTPFGITIGDIDGDGKLDIATANAYGNSISILRNTSTGIGNLAFTRGSDYATGTQPYSITMGDLDGDGKPELIAGISTGSGVTVFRNTSSIGTISLNAGVNYSTGTSSNNTYLSITDIDGDGKPDICAADGGLTGTNKSIALLRNLSTSGNLSFDPAVNYTTGANNAFNTALGDFDGDGKPDIVVANNNSGTVSVFRNQVGEPAITSFTPSSSPAGGSVIINGTNLTGATAVSFGGVAATSFTVVSSTAIIATVGNGASGYVTVTTPNGTTNLSGFTFTYPVPTITSFSPTSGAIGTTVTITGTNFSATATNNIVYFGAVKATVSAATTTSITVTVPAGASYLPVTVTTNGLTAASLNSFDVTFPGGGSAFTSSLFSAHQDNATNGASQSILLGDFDNDGKADYVYVTTVSTGMVYVYRNTGSGKTLAFTAAIGYNTGQYPCSVVIADIDGDGKLDLAVTNSSSSTVTVLRNTSSLGNISFAAGINYTTGNGPVYFAVGDIDGDGKPDIVISNSNNNNISVFLNNGSIGAISFAAGVVYTLNSNPTAIAISDLNNDGKPDIAVTTYNSPSVSVFINRSTAGSLSFDSRVDFATTSGAYNLDIHDMDGDGKPDLIIPNNSNNGTTVSVFRNLNTGSGAAFTSASFAAKIDYPVGTVPAGLSIADIDGDGKPDIAVANRNSNTISLLRNTSSAGNISFDSKVDFATPTDPRSVVLGDVDNDGKPDMLSANPTSNTISIFRNQLGEPAITSFTPTSAAAGASVIISGANFTGATAVTFGGVAATSFTVVSSTAIIATVGNGASGIVTVTTPVGSASLTGFTFIVPVPTITSFSPTAGPIGTTVTITGTNFNTTAANNVVYFGAVKATVKSATSTTIAVAVPFGATYQPITVTTSNLTAFSTKPFMVTFAGGGTLDANSFGNKSEYNSGSGPNYGGIQDIDGDGKPDLISVNQSANTISLFRNTTSNKNNISFAPKYDINTGTFPLGASFADFDGDGIPDLIVSNYNSNTISVFRNNSIVGNFSFSSAISYATGSKPGYSITGDLDGDGKPDIIVANNSSATLSIYINTSTGTGNISFASKVDISVGSAPSILALADIDGDGKIDIICPNQGGSNVSILRNTSTGAGSVSFSTSNLTSGTGNSGPRGVSVGDFDGDGKPDLVIANSYIGTITVYKNNSTVGNISFGSKSDYTMTSGTTTMTTTIADLDGDGKLDILVPNANTNNFISVLKNNSTTGTISFSSVINYIVGGSSSSPTFISVGDVDGDGKPDIITANTTTNTLSVIRNQIGEPVISSFTPTSQSNGQSVIINGANFTGTTSVTFGGVAAASYTVVSSSAIIATVGFGATGSVSVTTPGGTASMAGFTYTGVIMPTISSFFPLNATTGTNITISGTNFTGVTAVTFGGINASSFTVINPTTISAVVANGASGSIGVTTSVGTATATGFIYCSPATTYNSSYSGCNSVIYKGITYNSSTTVRDTAKSTIGCDSAYNVASITVYKVTATTNNVNLSGCNSLIYKGITYTNSTVLRDTVKSNYGCDSIYNIATLTVNKITATTNNINLSGCNSLVYKGISYTNSTIVKDTVKSSKGCDSIYNIASLTIYKIIATTNTINLSGCNAVFYKGNTYLSSITIRDTVTNSHSCDSIYNVANIVVNKIIAATNNINVSGCNSVIYKGNTYINSTTLRDTVKSNQGCDSIYNIANITVNKIITSTNNINLNDCNSIVYKGITYTNSTIVKDTVKSSKGCDSIYNIASLTIYKIIATTNTINLSGCNAVFYKGNTYLSSITIRDTVKSSHSCDSIYNVANIVVNKIIATTNYINLSGCNSVIYKGNTYTASTVVKDTVKSYQGCDSIYNIANITVNKLIASTNNINLSGCNSIVYKGITYTNSTTIRDTTKTGSGCDSIYTIANISIYKITATTNNVNQNGCDSVLFKGITYKTSTILKDTVKSTQGCDSIYNISNITVTSTPVISQINSNSPVSIGDTIKLSVVSNNGIQYSWHGPLGYSNISQNSNPIITPATVNMSGYYYVSVDNNGCTATTDSVLVTVSSIYSISGRIYHPKGFNVVDITLNASGSATGATISNSTGNYSFNFGSGGNYKVVPSTVGRSTFTERDKDRRQVTTLDIALIQSHILQKNLLSSPYKIIAADVNNDGRVSTLDIVFMKRLILGIDTSFAGNKQWAFIDSNFVFADPANPFPHKDSIVYNSLSANQSSQTFIGFILGDVNWSASAPKTITGKSVNLQYNELSSNNSNLIHVPFTVNNFKDLMGIQYTLNFNNDAVEFVGLTKNTIGLEYANHADGKISFLWNDVNNETKTFADGTVLFEMVFKPRKIIKGESILISSDITSIEALDGNFNTHNVTLEKVSNSTEIINKELWVITPNPTEGMIKIKMVVKESKTITFQLMDAVGKTYFTTKLEAIKGNNDFVFNLQSQNKLAAGIYYLKTNNMEGDKVKQIIVR